MSKIICCFLSNSITHDPFSGITNCNGYVLKIYLFSIGFYKISIPLGHLLRLSLIGISIMVILNKPQNNPRNKIYPCNSYSINWTTTIDCSVQVRKISSAFMNEYCAISPYFRYNYILILYIDIYYAFRRHIKAIKPNILSSMRINHNTEN